MNDAIINAITHSLTEQLNSAIEDIVASVMETHLECDDFDVQYDAAQDALEAFGGDIDDLAGNITSCIQSAFWDRIAEVKNEVATRFENEVLPNVLAQYEKDGIVDGPARREAWCNFVDMLNKDCDISDYEASIIDFDVESL